MTSPPTIRIGHGFDIHRLVEGRPLRLGGVTIPHRRGLDGHSDADALLHALCDAILGAAGEGDIGTRFPNSDAAWKGADSVELLRYVWAPLRDAGWRVVNLDCTVLAEEPKISPFRGEMKAVIGGVLGVSVECVGIKATTMEGLGAIGRGEGIAAHAVALLWRSE